MCNIFFTMKNNMRLFQILNLNQIQYTDPCQHAKNALLTTVILDFVLFFFFFNYLSDFVP